MLKLVKMCVNNKEFSVSSLKKKYIENIINSAKLIITADSMNFNVHIPKYVRKNVILLTYWEANGR